MQFVVDLSANELSLQFITHSQFEGDGSYSFLSQKVERITEQYYFDMLTLPLKTVRALLQADIVIVSRIFLTCTTEKINKMRVNTMMQCYRSHYFSLYKEYSIYFNDELATDPLMYTAFGKMLFSNDESNNSTKKIKNFIEQMKVKGNVKDILEYNDLVISN